jgi:hydrogenase maturation protease
MTNTKSPIEEAILVIGVGHPMRGDDGAGSAVVHNLRRYFREHPACAQLPVELAEANGDLVDMLEGRLNYSKVILVDAVVTGKPPGTLHRWDVTDRPFPACLRACSTHGFDLAGSIELNRALDRLPPSLIMYGIEASQFETGAGLSPAVKASARAVLAPLLEELGHTLAPVSI